MPGTPASSDSLLLGEILLIVLAVIAASLIQAARAHLKNPSQKSALALAANSSVIIWVFVGTLLGAIGAKMLVSVVSLGLAYVAYRFFSPPGRPSCFSIV